VFESHVLETLLDGEQRQLKNKVFELFRAHPDLLPAVEEGMTKGAGMQCGAAGIGAREVLCQVQVDTHRWPGQPTLPLVVCLPAEEHRALVRRQLLTVLGAGLSPLDMFANDLKARRDSLNFLSDIK
jgi:hypothetical protein